MSHAPLHCCSLFVESSTMVRYTNGALDVVEPLIQDQSDQSPVCNSRSIAAALMICLH